MQIMFNNVKLRSTILTNYQYINRLYNSYYDKYYNITVMLTIIIQTNY